MKRLFLVCLTLLLCMSCVAVLAEGTECTQHTASCSDPTTCTVCGATGITADMLEHSNTSEWLWYADADGHYQYWSCCNLPLYELSPHGAFCNEDPTVCETCGATGLENVYITHVGEQGYRNDGDTHIIAWFCCGETVGEAQTHFDSCSDDQENTCKACGATGIEMMITHPGDATADWQSDGDTHSLRYNCCGYAIIEGEGHAAYCTETNKCLTCGAEGEGFELIHNGEQVWQHDDTTHWLEWSCCGTISSDVGPHNAPCTAPNVCMWCSAENVEITLIHSDQSDIWSDENVHWYGCADCGEPFGDKIAHYVICANTGDRTKCQACSAPVDPSTVSIQHVELSDAEWEYDEQAHWRQECVCGECMVYEDHYASCLAPDAGCERCGYTGDIYVGHEWGETTYIDEQHCATTCIRCGEEELIEHASFSCLSNICEFCGSEFDNTDPNHSWDGWEYDETGCWNVCLECGEEVNKSNHWYTCAAPDTCANCGYVSPTATQYDHAWTEVYEKDNPDYHYKHCTTCGGEYAIASHTVSCANPGVCTGCGATGITVDKINHGNVTWEHNDTKHWGVCQTCGGTQAEGPHWTDCSKPNLCQDCGATGVTIDPSILSHFDVDWNNFECDETHHWYTCRTCNIKAFYGEHVANCTDAGTCAECGYTGDFDVQHPALKAGWAADENNHWKICAVCGDAVNKAAHSDDDENDECDVCKQALAHTHKWGEPVTVEATCTADGSKTTTCTACGEKTVETIKATGHAWGEPVIVAATCTKDGSKTTTCANCTEKTVETIKATGHAWGEPVIVAATCTKDGSKTTACANCGEKTVETIKATGHAWGEPVIVAATCTKDGSKTTTCANCDEKTVETIKATGHAWGEPAIVAATCTKDGSKTTACANCGEKTVETIKATGHAWGEPVIVAATCTKDGSKTTACANCDEKTVETIKATGHAWGEPVIVAATCTKDGSKTTTCANCDEKTVETIKATGHAWGEPVIVAATCTKDGSKTITCANCTEKTVETIKATGHAWGEPVIVAATCTKDGSKTTSCANCGEKTVETIKATGHAWGEPVIVAATCTKDGSKTTACANCDEKTVETIKATGHAWGEPVIVAATCTEDGSKTTICSNCNETAVEMIPSLGGHKFKVTENVAATCTTEGRIRETCMVCYRFIITKPAAAGHAWGEPVTVDATCTEAGSKTITCANCGEKTVETIKAIGHAWGEPVTVDATCTEAGSVTITCANCGEKTVETIAATGHAWGEPVTVEATCTEAGSVTTTCSACGEETVETIAATGHAWGEPVTVEATCTEAGSVTTTCSACGEETVEPIEAKGHAYDLVYKTQGNGTHAKTCADCGAVLTAKCNLVTTQMGFMTCSACATCGYTVYTFNEAAAEKPAEPEKSETTQEAADANANASAEKTGETAPAVTEAKAETVVKRVENVSFELVAPAVTEVAETKPAEEPAEKAEADASTEAAEEAEKAETEPEAPAEQSEVVLVVHETKVEMKVELPDTVTAEVKKVLAVSMLKEGNAIQPAAAVKLSIPVVEEEVTGLKLMLMTEDGELLEIEYEIIDGKIVFATEAVGVFLFVDAEAVEA